VVGSLLALQAVVFVGFAASGFSWCCSWWFAGAAVGGLLALQLVVCWHCSWWFVDTAVSGLLVVQSVVLSALQLVVSVSTAVGGFCWCCSWWFVDAAAGGLLVLWPLVCWHCSQWFAGAAVGGLLVL